MVLVSASPGCLKSYGQYAMHLIVFQTVGFVFMEIGERVFSGHGLALLPMGLLALGVVIQAVIALLAALVIVALEAVGAGLARPRAGRARAATSPGSSIGQLITCRSAVLDASRPRGPPALQLT